MILSEIFTVDMKKDVWRPEVGMPPTTAFRKEDATYLGKRGDITFYWDHPTIIAFRGEEQAGYVLISQVIHTSSVFDIRSTAVNPKYQGHGLGAAMYEMFLKHDKRVKLISDDTQSEGGRAIWRQLADTPGIEVYVWDRETNEYETLTGEELDSDEYGVYGDGPKPHISVGELPRSPKKLLVAMAK